jgi:hypothetical protein
MAALNSIRKAFDNDLESAKLLFDVAQNFADHTKHESTAEPPVSPAQARRIAGLAFLVMVRAWEELVEGCLVRYIAGASAPNGNQPILKCNKAATLSQAYEFAKHSPSKLGGGQGYLSVSEWKKVKNCANHHFCGGEPFSRINSHQVLRLTDATAIRNRIAHSSKKCREAFLSAAGNHEPPQYKRPRGYTVGHLLLTVGQRGFGRNAKKQAFFLHYHGLFLDMAGTICPSQKPVPVSMRTPT